MLQDIKDALRLSGDDLNQEVIDLIQAAKSDLMLSGVLKSKVVDSDPLIKRAVIVYCKANFGWDNPESDKFQKSYDMLKEHLTLSVEYTEGGAL
ncbi:head-tail connector protein [Micromonospora provocatoris]